MAQVRAGVRLRKALCAVLEHPSVSHRFEGLGLTILEVRMAKDFKKAHVRWTVADVDEDDEYARHAPSHAGVSSSSSASSSSLHCLPIQDTRRRFASSALRRNATRLRSMASKMLRSKHTPRLVFVDDDARSVKERELDAAFDRAADEAARNDAYAAEVKAREAEVLASARRRDGTSDSLGPYDDDALDETDETDVTDGSLMGYAFEMHDGSTPYVSDFDDAVDALVAEMAEAAVGAEEGEEEDGEWFDDDEDDDEYDGDDEHGDDDDDDEYVEGDEFDDDDDDEAEDFDFDKFDEAERRTRR
jgi:ribosome-binding factor A